MRLGSVARWVVVLAVLAWAGYTVLGLGLSYFSVQEMIDAALRDALAKHRAAFAVGSQLSIDALVESVRGSILLAALHDGLQLDKDNVERLGQPGRALGQRPLVSLDHQLPGHGRCGSSVARATVRSRDAMSRGPP